MCASVRVLLVAALLWGSARGAPRSLHRSALLSTVAQAESPSLALASGFGPLVELLPSEAGSVNLVDKLAAAGFQNCDELCRFARDFETRPEALSTVLNTDFEFTILDAHKLRAAVMQLLKYSDAVSKPVTAPVPVPGPLALEPSAAAAAAAAATAAAAAAAAEVDVVDGAAPLPTSTKRPSMKKMVINSAQTLRRAQAGQGQSQTSYAYGLTQATTPPHIAKELEDFHAFMTELVPGSQEAPIRAATATVYSRHARLFLGWHLARAPAESQSQRVVGGVQTAFPTKAKEGAREAYDFVLWLRRERRISATYEANMIRGLIKLAKFRFSQESLTDPEASAGQSQKTFDDIPVVRELRKLHRQTEKQRKLSSTRVSDEHKKWLSWIEFLDVVQKCQAEADAAKARAAEAASVSSAVTLKKMAAVAFQQWLVLAFFAVVPDRQRTIRELEIGRTFVRHAGQGKGKGQGQGQGGDEASGPAWSIVHGAADYKTGKSYGDRPPLPIPASLTGPVDEFIRDWRPCLEPQGMHLFAQTKGGGKPLTQDSVYQIVSRSCFRHSGKRTNPHLLRDMVVTHVRSETDASEKDLEALALFMGHSLNMQKTSYDRRTLTQKVAPAVSLLASLGVGNKSQGK